MRTHATFRFLRCNKRSLQRKEALPTRGCAASAKDTSAREEPSENVFFFSVYVLEAATIRDFRICSSARTVTGLYVSLPCKVSYTFRQIHHCFYLSRRLACLLMQMVPDNAILYGFLYAELLVASRSLLVFFHSWRVFISLLTVLYATFIFLKRFWSLFATVCGVVVYIKFACRKPACLPFSLALSSVHVGKDIAERSLWANKNRLARLLNNNLQGKWKNTA